MGMNLGLGTPTSSESMAGQMDNSLGQILNDFRTAYETVFGEKAKPTTEAVDNFHRVIPDVVIRLKNAGKTQSQFSQELNSIANDLDAAYRSVFSESPDDATVKKMHKTMENCIDRLAWLVKQSTGM